MSKVWFITGVSSGLGRALADAVLATGDTVIGTLRKAEQCAAFEAQAPGRALACQVDLADAGQIAPAFDQAVARAGRIDVLVNNAGFGLLGALEESSDEDIRAQMETNFFAPVTLIRCALPLMRAQGAGRIFNVSSSAGFAANQGLVAYSASKHALTGMSHGLAQELQPLGIHVTSVEPGGFRTEWVGPSMSHVACHIPDYDRSAGATRQRLGKLYQQQRGDPARAAQALITAAQMEEPPVFLLLGPDAANMLRNQMKLRADELERFEALTNSTDFPDWQPPS